MTIIEWLEQLARKSGIADLLQETADAISNSIIESKIQNQRETFLEAINKPGLTSGDVEKLFELAEPELIEKLEREQLIKFILALRTARKNKKPGPGVLNSSKDDKLFENLSDWKLYLDPNTPPKIRLETAKKIKIWPDIVEAMYRGELEAFQKQDNRQEYGRLEPSEAAEAEIAEIINFSASEVRRLCKKSRDNRLNKDTPENPPLRVNDFKRWLRTGGALFPDSAG